MGGERQTRETKNTENNRDNSLYVLGRDENDGPDGIVGNADTAEADGSHVVLSIA